MNEIIKTINFEKKLIDYNGKLVLLDATIAELYGVKTSEVNQAVSNNLDKFPQGYVFELTKEEKLEVVKNFDNLSKIKYSPHNPKVFTEEGLYMLATILKSSLATQTTISIIETFKKIRKISKNIKKVIQIDNPQEQKEFIKRSNELLHEVIDTEIVEEKVLDKNVNKITDEIEINLGILKFKRTIENKNKD